MLVLITDAERSVLLDAEAARRLAEMGVVSVSIAADRTTEAVVLEGWAFDPVASGAEAADILVGAGRGRTLQPVLQTVLPSHSDSEPE
jgi:hypothetical protein